jgi:hypothetical protein
MKNMIKAVVAVAAVAALTACGGGGGGGNPSTGGTYFTHEQLASEFVRRVNVDVAGYDLTLVKTNTLQYDYIVVYDKDYKTYDAYYIGNYNPGENLKNYLNNYEYKFYYDLIPESGNTYRDYVTGKVFEVDSEASMDLDQVAGIEQMISIKKNAKKYRKEYGMSEGAAKSLARYSTEVANQAPGSFDKARFDAFSKSLTGSTYSDVLADEKAGNTESLKARLATAQQKTGMKDAEKMKKLMNDLFE